ncbi:MAG: HAD-IA family hydrolase [Candidatus Paceibacterota bacterium]|jgi:HAD superfamily hydrolase (TIGR01509 family)
MYKAILFDMVGPLLQKRPDYIFDEVVETLERIKNTLSDDADYLSAIKNNPILQKYSLGELMNRNVNKYQKIPEVWNLLLPKLKNRFQLGVINNGTAMTISRFKERDNFAEYFDIFINSSEEHLDKPSPEIFLFACEKMHVKPDESVFIDDSQINVEGAERVGMKGIQYKGYADLITQLTMLGIV